MSVATVDARVAVVGGGLAGVFVAAALLERGIEDVVVVERAARVGGLARTITHSGFSLEPAAGTLLLPNEDLTALLDLLKVETTPSPASASSRYVYLGGVLVEVPTSPKALLAPLMSPGAKLAAALEPFRPARPTSEDESLQVFLRRRLGSGAGRVLSWLAASGVFAGDPSSLSARSSFPVFPALEEEGGSIVRGALRRRRGGAERKPRPASHLPVGGMSAIGDQTAVLLGDRLRTGTHVRSVRRHSGAWTIEADSPLRATHVVMATPRAVSAELLGGALAQALDKPGPRAPVAVLGLGWDGARAALPNGFGALVGPDEGMVTRGVLFESSYAPGRAPAGKAFVKVIAGGAGVARLGDDDAGVVEAMKDEATRILGCTIEPEVEIFARHPTGIPQYDVGHARWLGEVDRAREAEEGLHLAGWDYRGVGVAHLASDARRIAEIIAAR